MPSAQLPALPPELMERIARAALAVEGADMRAWARLSLVCRTWRESLRGARLRVPLSVYQDSSYYTTTCDYACRS